MQYINLLLAILKDERGQWQAAIPAAVNLGSTLLGSMFGKKKKKEEIYDPYAAQRSQYTNYLSSKLGTSTPYSYNEEFTLDQPDVEKAAESTILGKLGNLPKAEDYKAKVEAAKQQDILREKNAAAEQQTEESNMYNRLGLVSSTPWMARAGELGEESLMRQGDISSGYDMYGLDYGLKADQLADEIARGWTGEGTVLGGAQRGYQQYGQQASEEDIKRMSDEEQNYAQLMQSLIGGQQPVSEVSNTPNTLMQLTGMLQNPTTASDIATLLGKILKR